MICLLVLTAVIFLSTGAAAAKTVHFQADTEYSYVFSGRTSLNNVGSFLVNAKVNFYS